jgi:hypothetical protein
MPKKKKDNLVLVGFGNLDLEEMLTWIGTDKEQELLFAPYNMVPRYRTESACSEKNLTDFLSYVKWASEFLERAEKAMEIK